MLLSLTKDATMQNPKRAERQKIAAGIMGQAFENARARGFAK